MTEKYPSQLMDRFTVRMPAGMRDEIARIAEENGRSMNSEIVRALELYLNGNEQAKSDDTLQRLKAEIVDELEKRFNITRK
nr:Arc family DNA-binding protein [Providencia alcalifaciens]